MDPRVHETLSGESFDTYMSADRSYGFLHRRQLDVSLKSLTQLAWILLISVIIGFREYAIRHSETLLQKVAKDPECHSCESRQSRASARNPFFSDG